MNDHDRARADQGPEFILGNPLPIILILGAVDTVSEELTLGEGVIVFEVSEDQHLLLLWTVGFSAYASDELPAPFIAV
jgi:hypothetical protein